MKIADITVRHLKIPFRTEFRHASASRNQGDSIVVTLVTEAGITGFGEGCPREYVTGENARGAATFVHRVAASVRHDVHDFDSLCDWARRHETDIDNNPAAWCALELAILDALAREHGVSVGALFADTALADRQFRYTAVIGAGSLDHTRDFLLAYRQVGFADFKMKLCGDPALDCVRLRLFENLMGPARLRLDANNLWRDAREAGDYLARLPDIYYAVEEPLQARDFAGLARLLCLTNKQLIADESLLNRADLERLLPLSGRCIANIRVSKMGGVIRSRKLLKAATSVGMPSIIGAHVGETSLLTRAAMLVGSENDDSVMAREGAVGEYLLSRDLCTPSLRFSEGGKLQVSEPRAGLGCGVNADDLSACAQFDPPGARFVAPSCAA